MNDKYHDFITNLQNATESEHSWLVMDFSLQNLSKTLQQLVWAAAIPHWFDQNFLNAIIATPLKDEDFKALTELSYVEIYPDHYFNIHEHSRQLLLNNLLNTNKKQYLKLNQRAVSYCQQQDQHNTLWWVETIYQQIIIEPKPSDYFFNLFKNSWNSYLYEKLDMLLRVTNENEENTILMENRIKIMESVVDKIEIEVDKSKSLTTLYYQDNWQFLASMIELLPKWVESNKAQNLIRNLIKTNYFVGEPKIYCVFPLVTKMIEISPHNIGEIINEALPLIHKLEKTEPFIVKFAKVLTFQIPNIMDYCEQLNQLIYENSKSSQMLITKLIRELLTCDVEIKAKLLKSTDEIHQTINDNKQLFQLVYG